MPRRVPQRGQFSVGQAGSAGVVDDCLELPVKFGNRRRTVVGMLGGDVAQHPQHPDQGERHLRMAARVQADLTVGVPDVLGEVA